VVVVFVAHGAVEAGFRCVEQLVEVHAVERLGALGAEVLVGEHEVVVATTARLVLGIRRVAHLGEEVNVLDHLGPPTPRETLARPGRTLRAAPSPADDRTAPARGISTRGSRGRSAGRRSRE